MRSKSLLFTLFLVAFVYQSAGAATRDVELFYNIYVGGFHVIDLKAKIGLRRSDYDFSAKAKSVGMIGRMFPWWMKAYSRGKISEAGVKPMVAGQRNSWRGKDRFIDLKFADGVATIDRISPEPKTDDRAKVPFEMRVGVMDLASAIISIIRKMDVGQSCQAQMPVFDGRRRYDLMVAPDGNDIIKPSGYTPYIGGTVNCRLTIDKKAGFKKTDKSGWNDRERSARIWMGKPFGDVPPVPVRLTINTPLGFVIAHLNGASVESKGRRTKLKRHETTEKK